MTDIDLHILRQFEQCGSPCAMFSPRPATLILKLLKRFVTDGLLRSIAGPTATSGDNLWFECLVLTDEAGREACGLKPIKVAKPENPQKELW